MSLKPEQIGRLAKSFEEIFKMALDRRGRPLRTVYSVAEAPRIQGDEPMTDSLSQHCPNCEAQAAEIERLREALRDIQIEAERERGNWTHLKQVIARKARAALGDTK